MPENADKDPLASRSLVNFSASTGILVPNEQRERRRWQFNWKWTPYASKALMEVVCYALDVSDVPKSPRGAKTPTFELLRALPAVLGATERWKYWRFCLVSPPSCADLFIKFAVEFNIPDSTIEGVACARPRLENLALDVWMSPPTHFWEFGLPSAVYQRRFNDANPFGLAICVAYLGTQIVTEVRIGLADIPLIQTSHGLCFSAT
ncbi:hypothetical protein B0H13DRAFT_1897741 [Mycena leptocephala]|nr:hypothetical protein B0H13DRAFT_1897741 [Mycena leptocephala]